MSLLLVDPDSRSLASVHIVSVYLQAVLPEMLRPGTASLTLAEGSDQMQAVQPGTQQQQQQQARQHSGPYGLLDEQDEDNSSMSDSAAPALSHQQERQHQQQQARQHSGLHGLPHDQGGSSAVMEDSAAHQQVSLCF